MNTYIIEFIIRICRKRKKNLPQNLNNQPSALYPFAYYLVQLNTITKKNYDFVHLIFIKKIK